MISYLEVAEISDLRLTSLTLLYLNILSFT